MKMYGIKISYRSGGYTIRWFSNWNEYWEEWNEYMQMYCYDREITVTGLTVSSRRYHKA